MSIPNLLVTVTFEYRFIAMVLMASLLASFRMAKSLYVASFLLMISWLYIFELHVLSGMDKVSAFYDTLSTLSFFIVLFVFCLAITILDPKEARGDRFHGRFPHLRFTGVRYLDVAMSFSYMGIFAYWSWISW